MVFTVKEANMENVVYEGHKANMENVVYEGHKIYGDFKI